MARRNPQIVRRSHRLSVVLALGMATVLVANMLSIGYWMLTEDGVVVSHREAVRVPHPEAHIVENRDARRKLGLLWLRGARESPRKEDDDNDGDGDGDGDNHDPAKDTAKRTEPNAKGQETSQQRNPKDEQQKQKQQRNEEPNRNQTNTKKSLLNCERYGGPYDSDSLDEMVYWKVIPEDWTYSSKFKTDENTEERFLTFDTDMSGFNNQRMVFEINLAMAIVTGRTLVLHRDRLIDHIDDDRNKFSMEDFFDLESIEARLPGALKTISMDDFIAREGGPDKLDIPTDFVDFERRLPRLMRELNVAETANDAARKHRVDADEDADAEADADNNDDEENAHPDVAATIESVMAGWRHRDRFIYQNYIDLRCDTKTLGSAHCSNTTDWTSLRHVIEATRTYRYYIDEFFYNHPKVACPNWGIETCLVAIPDRLGDDMNAGASGNSNNSTGIERFGSWMKGMNKDFWSRHEQFVGAPPRVNDPPEKRLQEVYQTRLGVCIYDKNMQNQKYYHMRDDATDGYRLVAHWYDYIFFEDWREDLWTKRFFRDQLRYHDRFQCAAARIVAAIRDEARTRYGHPDGSFHAMHIRRTDLITFYQKYDLERNASQIYETATLGDPVLIPRNSVVYVATDEADKQFFDVFRDGYQRVYFLDDFVHLLGDDFPKEYYGMIDQLVASRGKHFVGTYYSTFTGYINRLRGYHSQKHNTNHREENPETARIIRSQGTIPSWFYSPPKSKDVYQRYEPMGLSLFEMEYALAWRNIDLDVDPELRAALEEDEAEERVLAKANTNVKPKPKAQAKSKSKAAS